MGHRPTYPIDSVDSALRLLQILHRDGQLRVTSAARELGVAPSTAHRLLAMLVYRGFAVQQPDRSYRLGSSMPSTTPGWWPRAHYPDGHVRMSSRTWTGMRVLWATS